MHDEAPENRFTLGLLNRDGPDFEALLRLRRDAYGRPDAGLPDSVDFRSFHVGGWYDGRLVGAMRVTCRRDGPLESERFYPDWLIREYAPVLCASSRLVVERGASRTLMPILVMRRAWEHAISLGIRVDVSQVRRRAIPYYLRIGGFHQKGSHFAFERWKVTCGLVAFPVHPDVGSPFADLFASVSDPCQLATTVHRDRFTRLLSDVRQSMSSDDPRSTAG